MVKEQKWGVVFPSSHPHILGAGHQGLFSLAGLEYSLWEIHFTEFLELEGLVFFLSHSLLLSSLLYNLLSQSLSYLPYKAVSSLFL